MTIRLRLSPLPLCALCALLFQIVAGTAPPTALAAGSNDGIAGAGSVNPRTASTPDAAVLAAATATALPTSTTTATPTTTLPSTVTPHRMVIVSPSAC